jgi:tripartite-type tricarboxylate transporter receptor subunit TctC
MAADKHGGPAKASSDFELADFKPSALFKQDELSAVDQHSPEFFMTNRSLASLAAAVVLTVAVGATSASAQTCSTATKIIVAYPPGSPDDMIARLVAQKLGEKGPPVVVENLPGAAGKVGNAAALKAPADGCTLLIVNSTVSVHAAAGVKTGYDIERDFAPVAFLAKAPETISVHPGVAASSVKELAALVKANPGKFSYASPGFGSSPHLAGERLFHVTLGLDVAHVPHQGGPPAVNATIGGHTQVVHLTLPVVAAAAKDGRLRMLAVADQARHPMFPDVPTLAEAGVPGHEIGFWNAMVVAKATPPSVVEALHRQVNDAMAAPDVQQKLLAVGFMPVGGPRVGVVKHLADDIARVRGILAATGIKIE